MDKITREIIPLEFFDPAKYFVIHFNILKFEDILIYLKIIIIWTKIYNIFLQK